MKHSESIGKISDALAKAQGEMKDAAKDEKGNFGNYADLASIWDACRAPLSKHGIAVVQAPGETADKVVTMTTIISHTSGEWFCETLTIPMTKVDAQGYGSAVTYARRYALAAMVGIAPAEDDGASAKAIGGENNAPRRNPPPKSAPAAAASAEPAPPEGFTKWGDWTDAFLNMVSHAESEEALEKLLGNNRHDAALTKQADPAMHQAIGAGVKERREALQRTLPPPF